MAHASHSSGSADKLNGIVTGNDDSRLVATLDMDLFKRALKLQYLDPKYNNKSVMRFTLSSVLFDV